VVNERTFFNLKPEAVECVVDLNLHDTIRPAQVFGEVIANQRTGSILNISSMSAQKPLTRVVGYSVAKAAVGNLTKWLAVELAKRIWSRCSGKRHSAPVFSARPKPCAAVNEDQSLTSRGQTIIDHTPMGRFGQPTTE
jgi:NAD(P)-dependent dehydrogenase (short-subunit alcohol dehydrogenase family)